MSLLLPLLLAFVAGLGLGSFYFGGLWLTVRHLPTFRYPVPLLLASFVARTAVVVVGFYFVMGSHWERVLVCLVGFLVVRIVLTARLRPDYLPAMASSNGSTTP